MQMDDNSIHSHRDRTSRTLFKLNRCHHFQKRGTQQSIKQFSIQLLMLAKLRAYAFTSSKTFVSVNNTVCEQTHIHTNTKLKLHRISGCTSNHQQQIFCLTVSFLSICICFGNRNNVHKICKQCAKQLNRSQKPLEK